MGELLPIRTPRLTVRMMTEDDAETLAAYRNDPAVAQHQLWELPYSVDEARRMLSGQRADEQLEPGGKYQLAIEVDGGVVVGDVFVGMDEHGGVAEIGYTLAVEHQRHGYASEAAGAVVAALFDDLGCVRVYGELDPVNVASQRVLERIGLLYEGTAKRSFWWRGEWTDNMSYAATREEYAAWRQRPRTPPDRVRLVELNADNYAEYRALATHHSQQRLVAPVWQSMIQAHFPPEENGAPVVPWMRGIEADGEPAGFMMTAEASEHHPDPYLWRLLIDRRHQRRGIGDRALDLLVERLRGDGHRSLMVSWHEDPGSPRPFYLRRGFVPTGEVDDGETVARLDLTATP